MPRPKLYFDCWLNFTLFGTWGSDHQMIDKTVLIPNYGLLSFDQKNNLSDIHETEGRYPAVLFGRTFNSLKKGHACRRTHK